MTTMQMIMKLVEPLGNKPEGHKLYWALQKGMPEDKVREAAELWLNGNGSEANNMVFQYTSPYGRRYHNSLLPQNHKGVIYLARLDKKAMPTMGISDKHNRQTRMED